MPGCPGDPDLNKSTFFVIRAGIEVNVGRMARLSVVAVTIESQAIESVT